MVVFRASNLSKGSPLCMSLFSSSYRLRREYMQRDTHALTGDALPILLSCCTLRDSLQSGARLAATLRCLRSEGNALLSRTSLSSRGLARGAIIIACIKCLVAVVE